MAGLPKLKGVQTIIATGPKLYRLTQEPMRYGPPGEAPPGFVTPRTSLTEWYVYWGLAQIFGVPKPDDLRKFPFIGGPPIWTYQAFADAGKDRADSVDFVVWAPWPKGTPIAIRVQTEWFHNFTTVKQQLYDISQRDRLSNGFVVMDIQDSWFMHDKSGAAVIVALKQMLGMINRGYLPRTGFVQRV